MVEGRSKRVRAGSTVVLLLIALAAPPVADADRAASGQLVISGSQWHTDAPTRLAAAAGYFDADTGVQIRVELATSGKQSLEQLMAGEAEFALMTSVPLAMALVRLHNDAAPPDGWPVVLASVGLSSRTHHLIADAGRGIELPSDLAGRTLGLPLDTLAHFGWDQFANLHGIDTGAVRLVDARPGELAAGLAAARFDAVVAWTPISEGIVEQLGARARSFPMEGIDAASWLLVSRRDVLVQHPQAVDRVLQGYADAIAVLQTDPDTAAALLDFGPNWLRDRRVAWKLALNWPVIANLEAKLAWSAHRLGMRPLHLSPRRYIERAPLERIQPHAISLPVWIAAGESEP